MRGFEPRSNTKLSHLTSRRRSDVAVERSETLTSKTPAHEGAEWIIFSRSQSSKRCRKLRKESNLRPPASRWRATTALRR